MLLAKAARVVARKVVGLRRRTPRDANMILAKAARIVAR
jgi:hypothetical protein